MEELKVTSPEEYEQILDKRFEFVRLRSGMVVRARRANMEGLALKGGIPLSLVASVQEVKARHGEGASDADLPPDKAEEGQAFMQKLVMKHCLEPEIVYSASGELAWQWPNGTQKDADEGDLDELAAWIRGEEKDEVDTFRNRKERRASTAQSRRAALRPETVETAEGQPA